MKKKKQRLYHIIATHRETGVNKDFYFPSINAAKRQNPSFWGFVIVGEVHKRK